MHEQRGTEILGPLGPFFDDPDVLEIMVDGWDRVYVERKGRFEDVPSPFQDEEALLALMKTLATAGGRRLDEHQPMVDVRLLDRARCNMVIPPIALTGPALVIRKFPFHLLSVDDLLGFGAWHEDIVAFLRACVQARLNIAISGGTGSGKTTVLNLMAGMIPEDERIIVVENATELRLPQRRVVRLESRPPDHEGKGEVTIRDLVVNALRMRPDRLILGEARAGEALEMLQAMTTGHDGSMFSIHATSPRDVLTRLETMATMHDIVLPLLTVRQMMATALDIITYQERMADGHRRMVKVAEVVGMQGDVIAVQDIFEFRQTGLEGGQIKGHFTATGRIPHRLNRFRDMGIDLPLDLFKPR